METKTPLVIYEKSRIGRPRPGSSVLHIDQLLLKYISNSTAVNESNYAGVEGSIVYYLKWHPYAEVLRKRNKLVLQCVDQRVTEASALFDGVIVTNQQMLNDYKKYFPNSKMKVIAHTWDCRFEPTTNHETFSLCYIGEPIDCIPGVDMIDGRTFADVADRYKAHNCHLSIRNEGSWDFHYKPATKVVCAAACDCNIIATREPSNLEILDSSYPYYTHSTTYRKTIEYAKSTFGTSVWHDALKMMREVKVKTQAETLVKSYVDFFDDL